MQTQQYLFTRHSYFRLKPKERFQKSYISSRDGHISFTQAIYYFFTRKIICMTIKPKIHVLFN